VDVPREPLYVALGEYDTGWHEPAASLERAAALAERAACAGAGLVVLPETCTTGFTMDTDRFAEPRDGESVRALAAIACRFRIHLLAGLSLRSEERPGEVHNAALLFDADGSIVAEYRKQRLFAYGREDGSYVPGNAPVIASVGGVRIAPFICYDLRFPELFRAVAPHVDAMVLIANWPAARRPHWDVLVRARAIENQCYVVAVNRVGEGGGIVYDGGSVAYDPWGDVLVSTATSSPDSTATPDSTARPTAWPVLARIDPRVVGRTRARYPFVADARDA
jgi:predicted amidohydrolase